MFHRAVLDRCGPFDEAVGFNEDYELWLRCCLLHGCEMRLVPGVVARWRVHASQTTSVRGPDLRAKDDQIRSMVLSRLPVGERDKYARALREYQRPLPQHVRARRRVRDWALGKLPGSAAEGIAGRWRRLAGRDG